MKKYIEHIVIGMVVLAIIIFCVVTEYNQGTTRDVRAEIRRSRAINQHAREHARLIELQKQQEKVTLSLSIKPSFAP